MSPRARRLLTASVIVAALLVLGRALSQFLADRWWAASVSPAAVLVITRRALLSLGLDLAGIALATLWFAVHVNACLRVLAQVPEREPGGNPALRAFLSRPGARGAGWLLAFGLGLLTAGGTSNWAEAVTLAGGSLHFGLPDVALGIDAGWFVTRLPLWLRAQAFVTVLVVLGDGTGARRLPVGRGHPVRARASWSRLVPACISDSCSRSSHAPSEPARSSHPTSWRRDSRFRSLPAWCSCTALSRS